jgi:hypothetical protein
VPLKEGEEMGTSREEGKENGRISRRGTHGELFKKVWFSASPFSKGPPSPTSPFFKLTFTHT